MNILYEDKSIIVCIKPAGVPTQTAKITEKDMVSELNNYIRKKDGDKALPIHVIHRLDREVKGILVFAKTKDAAAKLSKQIQDGLMNKHYVAKVEGVFSEVNSEYILLDNYLRKDSRENKAIVVNEEFAKSQSGNKTDIKSSRLKYKVIELNKNEDNSLLEIILLTGRFHQIRAQLSAIGHPIENDIKYGGKKNHKYNRNEIGLVAYRLEFVHPVSNEKKVFEISDKYGTDK